MTLSEKLYTLRKKNGLSQEELANVLNVSRQAISKWESGNSVPEKDNLIAISKHFAVSIDYLLNDDEVNEGKSNSDGKRVLLSFSGKQLIFGIIAIIAGTLGLIIFSAVLIFNPKASDKISGSSMITIDGNGLLLLLCIAVIIFGGILLLKNQRK